MQAQIQHLNEKLSGNQSVAAHQYTTPREPSHRNSDTDELSRLREDNRRLKASQRESPPQRDQLSATQEQYSPNQRLVNGPAYFQRGMECILRGLTYETCLIYLDDVIILSRTFEEHLFHLEQVFQRFRGAHIKLKPSKCNFACSQVNYLGRIVSATGVHPDPEKI